MVELIFLGLVDIITKFLKYLWILNIENIFYTRNLTNFSMEIGFGAQFMFHMNLRSALILNK